MSHGAFAGDPSEGAGALPDGQARTAERTADGGGPVHTRSAAASDGAFEPGDALYRVVDAIPHLAWIAAPDGSIEYVNERWFAYTGQRRGRFGTAEWLEVTHPDDRERTLVEHHRSVREGLDFEAAYRLRSRDGTYRYHLARTAVLRDASGRPRKRIGTATDIDDQKRLEASAAAARGRFEAALAGMTDGFVLFDRDWRYVFANDEWMRFTRKRFDDVAGQRVWDVAPYLVGTSLHQQLERSMSLGESVRFECYSKTLEHWFEIRAYPTSDGISVFSTSIHEAKLARRALEEKEQSLRAYEDRIRASEERFRALFEQSPVSLQIFDRTGACTFVNPAWERLFATSRHELEGFNLFTDPQLRALGMLPLIERAFAGEELRTPTHRFDPAASGRIGKAVWQDVYLFPIRGGGERVNEVAVIAIDVTEPHEARTRLEDAVTSRDNFLSAASHELRTPITSMLLRVQLSQRALERGDETARSAASVARLAEQMSRSLSQLARLVDEMLDITRLSSGAFHLDAQEGDLARVVADTVERLAPQLVEARMPLELSLPESAPARIDAFRVEQVITNLVTNAIRYARERPLSVTLSRHGGRHRLVVEDAGPGIAPEDRERVFQRFERLASPRETSGLGLGLYIVREIVVAHGGSTWVESGAHGGAAFVVELPALAP